MATQAYPTDTPIIIADRLAAQYHWNDAERTHHAERLYDIQRTTALLAIQDRRLLPAVRSAARVSAFLDICDERHLDAQRLYEQLDGH